MSPVVLLLLFALSCVNGEAFSYHKFFGPVSGQIHEVNVEAPHGNTIDYIAKPDYSYSYGIEDPHTGNMQKHEESRDGDVVHGQYSVLQADGTTRIVKYTADPKKGFQATVEYV